MKYLKKLLAMTLALCLVLSCVPMAQAASIADATIDMDAKCNLTIYKYDFTNAAKDGVWSAGSYVSTGQYDANVNNILGLDAVRQGADSGVSDLGNGQTSNGYAIKGVEYTYLKVANFYQFSESQQDGRTDAHIELLYEIDKVKGAELLAAIGLAGGKDSYANANALNPDNWYYQSDVLIAALRQSLAANATTLKNALEAYVKANGGTAMAETDSTGRSIAAGLPVGLYLLVETKVPEMVTSTTDPFFVSLPMTSVNGGGDGENGNTTQVTTGGHDWLYDVTIYPKNNTGIVTLEKTVREAQKDTGKNNGSSQITDGFSHNATASAGDTVEYQILSTLPTITSDATRIAEYTFQDVLSPGLSYDSKTPVVIAFFRDAACTDEAAVWNAEDGKFTISKTENGDGSHTMTISMTEAGLAEINAANTTSGNSNGSLYAGYSNYTLRITYAAILNSDERLIYGDAGNDNQVVLTWRRTSSSYYDTLIDDCHIYVYGINLNKTLSDGKSQQELFDQILFKAMNATDGYYITAALNQDEGVWYVTGHTDQESAATAMHPVTWNGKPGQLVIKGMEDDGYILTEIQTADGYTLRKESIDVTISNMDDASRPCDIYTKDALGVVQNDPRYSFDGGLDLTLANIPQAHLEHRLLTASAEVDGNAVTMLEDNGSVNALATLTVVNDHGFDLPNSGEWGAILLPLAGVALIGAALLLFLPRKRKEPN